MVSYSGQVCIYRLSKSFLIFVQRLQSDSNMRCDLINSLIFQKYVLKSTLRYVHIDEFLLTWQPRNERDQHSRNNRHVPRHAGQNKNFVNIFMNHELFLAYELLLTHNFYLCVWRQIVSIHYVGLFTINGVQPNLYSIQFLLSLSIFDKLPFEMKPRWQFEGVVSCTIGQ